MNNQDLLKALDNETNSSIMKLNSKKIKQEKFNMLKELQLSKEMLIEFMNKLKNYRFVDELHDIHYGCYVRWIKINNLDDIKLSNGGIVVDIKIYDEGCQIICKNMYNKIMQIKLNDTMVFQKITDQDHVILSALDYLNT